MHLITSQQLAESKRHSHKVVAYSIADGEVEAYGVILDFDASTLSILDKAVGVVHLIRENVAVYLDNNMRPQPEVQ